MRCMEMDMEERETKTRDTFKMMMMSCNLNRIAMVMKLFEDGPDEVLSEAELEEATPLSALQIEDNLALIREHGFGLFDS